MALQADGDTVRVLKTAEVVGQKTTREVTSAAPLYGFDAERLKREGATAVSDAVHRLPGVNLRDYGGAGGLKTVAVRGFSAGHTAVIYDGIALSDAQSGQIDISRYSVDNVAKLQLVIGDNDDIFITARAAASAASLSIMSNPIDGESARFTAQLRAGSFGMWNPYLSASTPLGDKAAIGFTGEFTHADNDYPFTLVNGVTSTREKRNNSRMNSGHAEVNATWSPRTGTTITSKAYYYDNNRRLPGAVIYYNDDSNEALRERNAMWQGILRQSISSKASLMVCSKFNYSQSRYTDVSGIYPGGKLDQAYRQREFYLSATALYTPSHTLALVYAADYAYNNLNSNLKTDTKPERNMVLQTFTAKYRSSGLTATARLLWSMYYNGCRRPGSEAARNANRLSPSLSLSWQPMPQRELYLRASYKHIFRMPTFSEAYFDHHGSTDIKPETTNQINAGATFSPQAAGCLSNLQFSVDAYANFVTDMIVAVPYNMWVWRITNLGKARIFGIDATAQAAIALKKGHDLWLNGNISYQRAQPRTNPEATEWMKQVAYIPKVTSSVTASWENPWANLSVTGTGVSHRFTSSNNTPNTRIYGYFELGLSAWRDFAIKGHALTLRASVLNLLDKQYEVVARYPMPGRSWQASVRFEF